ncbi:MAG: DUF4127 family protein [Anaerovibrio sp.]|uniref:DUF4127 family protein n=1 Tax=Anaerovibrio sp. TaxID=1872532 RepID=UPI0025D41E68|nr:DUF4127 family protein [Anaerovibrio sp.]MCR5176713.1 DUF4127 family protein [Anaerovibrio sp.]
MPTGEELSNAEPEVTHQVLLIPLDSRPPCSKLLIDNGHTAGISIITPPTEYMDYYTQAGETGKLREWTATQIHTCDRAIISIDQLLYGGLIASRNNHITNNDITALVKYLEQLHKDNPAVKLYAFSILPRMNPPDIVENFHDRKQIMEWSRLIHQYDNSPHSETLDKIKQLEQDISPDHLRLYREIYDRNFYLNCQLAQLVENGTLHQLVLGQDDGEALSLPNLKLQEFCHYAEKKGLSKDKLAVIHGADEVALSILANLAAEYNPQSHPLNVYVDYSSSEAAHRLLPYMAIDNEATATERLNFHKAKLVNSPDEADYILFISSTGKDTMNCRQDSLHKLNEYHRAGKYVALVDLTQSFSAQEALFPLLLKEEYPVNSLIAYAGWNTASNSIGTAVAQAAMYLTALSGGGDQDAIVCRNLRNLNNRFCEDYYYLKDVIDLVNINLRKKGYMNVYDLDLQHNYLWSTDMLQNTMKQRLTQYKHSAAAKKPFTLKDSSTTYQISDILLEAYFPWPRTFEINLDTTLKIRKGQK